MSTTHRYWVPAKRYGWGWSFPQIWQGWVVLAIWVLALIFGVLVIGPRIHPVQTEAFVVAMTAALVMICYWKGEPPRWRWGGDK